MKNYIFLSRKKPTGEAVLVLVVTMVAHLVLVWGRKQLLGIRVAVAGFTEVNENSFKGEISVTIQLQ